MNYPAAELRGIKMNFYLINPDAEHRGILLIKLGSEGEQLWHLDVFSCSNYGLGLLVAEFDSELLSLLNPEDRIERMMLYSEWGAI